MNGKPLPAPGAPWLGVLVLAAIVGCGTTQFQPQNRHLLEAIQTAVLSKNTEWLEAAAKQVRDQHEKHLLSDAEFKSLQSAIESAKAGDWKTAESRVFSLSEGQKPTAADVARVRERKSATK